MWRLSKRVSVARVDVSPAEHGGFFLQLWR